MAEMDAVMAQIYGLIDGVKSFSLAASQYASGITNSACTVLSAEAAAVLQRLPTSDVPTSVMNKIMQDGSAEYYNLQATLGGPPHKSVEEVMMMPRLGSVLKVKAQNQEFIRAGVFREILDRTCADVAADGGRDRWGAVVTKFAVAVCVVFVEGDFLVFDSHGSLNGRLLSESP